jgi:signal transduction histidine kinase
MKLLASLQNRMFLASATVAVIAVGFAILFVTRRVAGQAEVELQRGVSEAGRQLERHFAARAETLALVSRLIADLPKLKAAVETGDPPTVQPLLEDYRAQARADLLAVHNRQGQALGASGAPDVTVPAAAVRAALGGKAAVTFPSAAHGVLHVITVPIVIGTAPPEVLGTLSLGFALGDTLATEFKTVTQSEVVLLHQGRIVGATLPRDELGRLQGMTQVMRVNSVQLGPDEYVTTGRPLGSPDAPLALILRSRTERLHFLSTFRTGLVLAGLLGVLVAVGLSYAVALTVSRPLRAMSAAMREMTATGDLARKILLPRHSDDEDVAVLAAAFNTLTDAIARFQREGALRERLSALGGLSTVIAHEVRNPLMIIKAALRALRRAGNSEAAREEALADIDNEVARLNRIVGDVLDFARPVRLELTREDLNVLCRAAAAAALGDASGLQVRLSLHAALPPVMTDAERLRTVLVNVLTNAREAILTLRAGSAVLGSRRERLPGEPENKPTAPSQPDIELRTRLLSSGRVEVAVTDRAGGIEPAVLAHIFEPYFTTKRMGTGLGLAIAKNIVDALGGTLSASSVAGEGTEVRLELPAGATLLDSEPAALARAGG